MSRTQTTVRACIAMSGAVALGLAAHSATAQTTDPLGRMATATGPNEFILTTERDREVLTFDSTQEVRICNRSGKATDSATLGTAGTIGTGTEDNQPRPVPLDLEYAGQRTQVQPGQCETVVADRVTVSAAEPLQQGWDLRGTVETRDTWQRQAQADAARTDTDRTASVTRTEEQRGTTAQTTTEMPAGALPRQETGTTTTRETMRTAEAGTATVADAQRGLQEAQEAIRSAQQAMRQAEQAMIRAELAVRQAEKAQSGQPVRQAEGDDAEGTSR